MTEDVVIELAVGRDAAAIASILALNRDDHGLFQKPEAEIAAALSDFFVARDGPTVVACAGLHCDSPVLAEIYAVAVAPDCQRHGIGRRLMQACRQSALSGGVHDLWLATTKPEYFGRFGFQPISRWDLPLSVLLRKLRQTLQQPVSRWLPAILGRHTFMRCALNVTSPCDGLPLQHSQVNQPVQHKLNGDRRQQ